MYDNLVRYELIEYLSNMSRTHYRSDNGEMCIVFQFSEA